MAAAKMPAHDLAFVLSDVDGTLVTRDKRLTAPVLAAVNMLRNRGLRFTIASARPPFGMRTLIEALKIDEPMAAFNGGMIIAPDGAVLASHCLDRDLAREVLAFFTQRGVALWTFSATQWMLRDPKGVYVDHEEHTIATPPTVIADYVAHLDGLGKIVAVSDDFARLASLEAEAQVAFGSRATVLRSQNYYLDITHPRAAKADALAAIAKLVSLPTSRIATVGDGLNDIGMLAAAGFGIAMGNGAAAVQAAADAVVPSNEDDGFVAAAALILERAGAQTGASR